MKQENTNIDCKIEIPMSLPTSAGSAYASFEIAQRKSTTPNAANAKGHNDFGSIERHVIVLIRTDM